MAEEKCYRYGNWTRNKRLRVTDKPCDTMGPWWKPWQRDKQELLDQWIEVSAGPAGGWVPRTVRRIRAVGLPEIEYATDEEVARDRLRQRFAPSE